MRKQIPKWRLLSFITFIHVVTLLQLLRPGGGLMVCWNGPAVVGKGRRNERNMGETTWWISTKWSCHPSWPSTNHMTMWLIFHLRGLPWLLIPSPSTTNRPTAGLSQHSSKPPPGCNSAATISQCGWRFQMTVSIVWALGICFLFFWYVFLFFFFLFIFFYY